MEESEVASNDPPAAQTRRLLVAEDEPHIRRILRTVLEPEFELQIAVDGTEAIAHLESEVHFDLVLTDFMMPGFSGLDVLARARRLRHRSGTPVVMLTAKGQDADRERASSLGVDDFITKPFSPKKLLGRIRELLDA